MVANTGLDKMLDYGTHQHTTWGNLRIVFTAFSLMLIWTILVMVFLQRALGMGSNEIRSLVQAQLVIYASISAAIGNNPFGRFFLSCVFAPIWEEAPFRYAPFKMARAWDKESGNILATYFLYPAVIITSILFGVCHGGVINILIQGVAGFVLSWVMIKSGYKWAVLTHFMWNFMLQYGMPVLINTIGK